MPEFFSSPFRIYLVERINPKEIEFIVRYIDNDL
jgi:hypothetical protein